jgi:hypothetical protein
MKYDPAADGPEVKLIAFFRMYPEGSFSRRVRDVTERELGLRFLLSKTIEEIRRKDAASRVCSKRDVSSTQESKTNPKRTRS